MALIKCPECGKEISDKASVCVNCGYPVSEYVEELKREEKQNRIEQLRKQQEDEKKKYARCKYCGVDAVGEDGYCESCGSYQFSSSSQQEKTFSSEIRKTNYVEEKPKFWERWWFLVLMCLAIPPVGLCLLWIAKKPKYAPARTTLSVFLAMYAVVWCIAMLGESDSISTKTDSKQTEVAEQLEVPKDNDEKENEKYAKGLEKYESGKYLYVSTDDLKRYYANMEGAKIYCIIEVDDITDDGIIQSNITDGYMFSNFTLKEPDKNAEVGQTVAILGKVSGYNDYGIAGNSIEISNCYIFADGDDANEYKKEKSDKKLEKYFVVTEETAESGGEVSEEEYKSFCKELDYAAVLRNPSDYKNKYCKVSGTVSQTIEGIFDSITIYVEDSNGDKWECFYSYSDGENRLLQGDKVTVYGKCDGTGTATTILGEQVSLPNVNVEYFEIN